MFYEHCVTQHPKGPEFQDSAVHYSLLVPTASTIRSQNFLFCFLPMWCNVEAFISHGVSVRNWYVTQFSENFESASEIMGSLSQYHNTAR